MDTISRRGLLTTIGAGMAGLSGCALGGETKTESLHVGWVPIYSNVQHFVMSERDYYDELDVELSTTKFSSGPAAVKAFAADDIDIGFFGITPAMVLADRGVDADVLVANSRNGFKMVATDDFANRIAVFGRDPGRVVTTLDVEMERPRERTDREFVAAVERVREHIE